MGQAEQSAGLGPKTPAKPSDNGLVRVACHWPALETKPREGGGMQHGPRNNTLSMARRRCPTEALPPTVRGVPHAVSRETYGTT